MPGLLFRKNPALPPSCLTHVIQDGFGSSLSILLIVLAQVFGLSYTQVGLLKGVRAGSQALLEIVSGWIAERTGDALLLIIGLCILGLGFLALPLATGVFTIGLCFLVIGSGTALHHAPSSSLVVNNSLQGERSSSLGIYNASGDAGKLLFTGLFSLGVGLGIAWYEITALFGVLALLSAFAILLMRRRMSSGVPVCNVAQQADGGGPIIGGWGVTDWRSFKVLLLVSSIDTAVQTVAIIFIPFIMLAKGLPISLATGAAVILLAGGVFGKMGCGFLSEKIGAFNAFFLVQVLTAIGLIAIALSPDWIAMIILFPLGLVLQGSSSITYGHASNLIKAEKMARGYALLYAPGTFASIIGPIVFGLYADRYGISDATLLMSIIVLLSIPPMLLLNSSDGT